MLDEEGGLLCPPVVDAQCSEVYFFLGTRALKVAVLRLEAGLGLLLALGVELLQLLPPLSLWPRPLSSEDSFPGSDASDRPSLWTPSPSEPLTGSAWEDESGWELEEKEEGARL